MGREGLLTTQNGEVTVFWVETHADIRSVDIQTPFAGEK